MAIDRIGGTAGSRLPTGPNILAAITNIPIPAAITDIFAAVANILAAITNAYGEI
jgi:hypothetical protein